MRGFGPLPVTLAMRSRGHFRFAKEITRTVLKLLVLGCRQGVTSMAKRQTYFEQVPIELALRVARQEARKSATRLVSCAICKMPVELECCKIDEDGEPVHESCYIAKLAAHHRSKAS